MAQLRTPKIKVILTDPAFPGQDEGREIEVQARNVELVAWDRERARYGWPKGEDAPFLWMTYLAWRALMRLGEIPNMSLAEFEAQCLSVTSEEDDTVDPTQRAVTAG